MTEYCRAAVSPSAAASRRTNESFDATVILRRVVVDHLDSWTLSRLPLRRRATVHIGYLTRSDAMAPRLAIGVLTRLGWQIDRIPSPYETRIPSHCEFSELLLSLAVDRVEPFIADRLDGFGVDEWERARAVRCVTLAAFKPLRRALEAIEAARSWGASEVRIQRCGLDRPIAEASQSVAVRFYAAPGRWRMPARPDFREHEHDLWPAEATAYHLGRWLAVALFAAFGAACATFRRRGAGTPFDVVALTAKGKLMPRIDDEFWVGPLKALTSARVALIFSTPPEAACRAFYTPRVDAIYELGQTLRAAGSLPAHVRWHHLAAMFHSLPRLLRPLLQRRISPWMIAWLLRLYERAGFFEAFMTASDARVSWSMTEGHELNTQALAIATHRRRGLSLGTSWSLKDGPNLSSANNRNDVTFVWGSRHKQIFRASHALTKRYVTSGYPAIRAATTDPPAHPQGKRLICFYDNAPGVDVLVPTHALRLLYLGLLKLVEERSDTVLLLKTKRDDYRQLGTDIVSRVDLAMNTGKVIVRDEHGDLAAALAADAVVGVGASTLGLLAAQHGRPCVLFDPERALSFVPAGEIPNLRVIVRVEDLAQALEGLKANAAAAGAVDAFADSDGELRIAQYIASLISAFHRNAEGDDAMRQADADYRERYGAENVEC